MNQKRQYNNHAARFLMSGISILCLLLMMAGPAAAHGVGLYGGEVTVWTRYGSVSASGEVHEHGEGSVEAEGEADGSYFVDYLEHQPVFQFIEYFLPI